MSLTVIMHVGMISRLSSLTVHPSFRCRYSSSPHTHKSFNNFQNRRYKRCRFWLLAGCGPQAPLRNEGGRSMTQGEHKQCLQWFSSHRTGTCALSLYPCGCWWNVSTKIAQFKPVRWIHLSRLQSLSYLPGASVDCEGPLEPTDIHLSVTTEFAGLWSWKNWRVFDTKSCVGTFVYSTVTYE